MTAAPTGTADPYYSRIEDEWSAADRQDPAVWSDEAGPLSADQIAAYADDGYLALPTADNRT